MSNTRSSKCGKASPDDNGSPHVMFTDLPNTVLVDVAKFLPKPSQALFAVALAAPSPSWVHMSHQRKPSSLSRAILAATSLPCDHSLEGMIRYSDDPWAVLDFELVDESLASKLTDDDITAILICTKAVDKLKRLKLTGLVNITGRGLEPLRGSTVLEQVDLSLQKLNGSPKSFKSLISEDIVMPILDSIVDKSGSSLKHLTFPREWWLKHNIGAPLGPSLYDFFHKYKRLLQSRPFNCGACGQSHNCSGAVRDDWVEVFGVQFFTCYFCMRNFCDHNTGFYGCMECDKRFCIDCASNNVCDNCSDPYCKGCTVFERCEGCQSQCCSPCYNVCDSCSKRKCDLCHTSENTSTANSSDNAMLVCNVCKRANCAECTDSKNVRACSECDVQYCYNCLLVEYQDALDMDKQFCSKCAAGVVSGLLEENET